MVIPFRAVLAELWRDRVMRLTLALFVLFVAVAELGRFAPTPASAGRYTTFSSLPFLALAAILFWRRRRRVSEPAPRRFWAFLSAAYACWLIVRVSNLLFRGLVTQVAHLDLAQDLVYLVFYVCIVLALELRPERRAQEGPDQLLRSFRALAAAIFAFGMVVYFAILPSALNAAEYATHAPSFLLYGALDLYMAARLAGLYWGTTDPAWRETYRWLLLTASVWVISDLSFALNSLGVVPAVPTTSSLFVALQLDFLTVIAAARIMDLPSFRGLPPSRSSWDLTVLDRPARGFWGAPLVAYLVTLPVLHFGLYWLHALDPATRQAREILLLLTLVALTVVAVVYERRLAAENVRLSGESQERRQQAQRLAALGQLAAGIAHDFNNLMTVVMGSAGFIKREIAPEQARLRADVGEIEQAVRRGADMVRRLIAFGRREETVKKSADLEALVLEVSRALRRLLPESIAIELDGQGPPLSHPVAADPAAVEQILLNLATNSRDAMPGGGRLRIALRQERLDADRCVRQGWGMPGDYGVLSVSDTGTGMTDEVQKRLFEPFFTTKPEGEGSGLGMAMVADLARLSRGFVNVASAPGQGTTVTVYLPLAAEPAFPAAVPVTHWPAGGGETILVVEDEPAIRTLAQRTLESCGYRVLTASDGADGLRVFHSHETEIALVVSDVVMPNMSGPEMYTAIRRHRGLRFIFTTGYTDREIATRLDPAVPCLHKPWSVDDLIGKVHESLDRGTLRPES